jgi:hypothetical protein
MIPPLTLTDPRHEAFALHVASGMPPSCAYTEAGFSANNANARSKELLQDPDIQDRIGHLKFSLPKSAELKDRYAPSLLLMPQTHEEMLAWLWQVMSGTRKILPIQLRAATLFARMKGWHLAKPPPPEEASAPQPTPLIPGERQALHDLGDITFSSDITQIPCHPNHIQRYHSEMADLALIAGIHHPESRRVLSPSPAVLLPEDIEPPESPPSTQGLLVQASSTTVAPDPQVSPSFPQPTLRTDHGDPKSPSQPLHPQSLTSIHPQMGKNPHTPHHRRTARVSLTLPSSTQQSRSREEQFLASGRVCC